ncbi:MAG: LacI family DNA-binding transcriptional regulator, partial [Anaerolineae bacterium]
RVRQAAQELGYYPSASARSLRRQRTDKIGLALLYGSAYTTFNEFFAELIRLVAAAAEKRDYNLVLYTGMGEDPCRLTRIAQSREVDGLLLIGDVPGVDRALQSLLIVGMPLVVLGRPVNDPQISYVTPDILQGARLALGHLVELGHRRIGYVSFVPSSRYSQNRCAAYRTALEELGLPFDERLIAYASLEPESSARALQALLALDDPPTAVYMFNDRMAIEVLRDLARRGIRVPQQVAIVGFDDIRSASMITPSLTTIRHPIAEVAEQAVGILLAHRPDPTAPVTRLTLPVELVIRESTTGIRSAR